MESIVHIISCCITDPGLVRSHNEDTCRVDNESGYVLVADGMGGAVAGEVASGLFRETGADVFSPCGSRTEEEAQELLEHCFQKANSRMLSHIVEMPGHAGMGCTAELMVFYNSGFVLGHVGDSRTYCLRDGYFTQLTRDHTLVQEQLDQGLITKEEALSHAMRNVILRVVGRSDPVEVDILHSPVAAGDIFLLCSDGLSAMVEDTKIKEILAVNMPLAVKATMLVDQANHGGGRDNITVVLIEIQ